jgi:hypothetical protein
MLYAHIHLLGSVYLALFAAIGGVSAYSAYRGGLQPWRWLGEAFASLSLIYLFISYWHRGLRDMSGVIGPMLFMLAVGWELMELPREFREAQANPELSPFEKKITPLLGILISIPIYIVAGMAAFD